MLAADLSWSYLPRRLLVRFEGKGEGFALLVEGKVCALAFATLGTAPGVLMTSHVELGLLSMTVSYCPNL
ncbi:hypothetical protein E2C01_102214 [Portunus trituberculatus]|uniref:Uncharacterized protein n=1 Tax=Portunus trituberculatus TaxID=210409 RepID=A0A5B7KM85_PORTR|nr:hypothetical protein [Portunus trituberculatus]